MTKSYWREESVAMVDRPGGSTVTSFLDDNCFRPSIDALYDSMPSRALQYVRADYDLPAHEIGGLLTLLVSAPPKAAKVDPGYAERLRIENAISAEGGGVSEGYHAPWSSIGWCLVMRA